MSNTYAAHTFTLDTSTNVAGLTALKGSACDIEDAIVVNSPAVLTIDDTLIYGSLTGNYTVTPSEAALCTLAQVKVRGNIDGTGRDNGIAALIPLALRRLNVANGREFMPQVTEKRRFRIDSGPLVRLPDCDLRAVTLVTLHPESVTEAVALTDGTDYTLNLERLTSSTDVLRLASGLDPYSTFAGNFGYAQVDITGAWGIWGTVASVSADINEAAIECVLAWLDKGMDSIAGMDGGGARDFMPSNGATFDIPSSAYRKCQSYNRHLGAY
jgi:hypothetical protein